MNIMGAILEFPITSSIGWGLLHSIWQVGLVALILRAILAVLPCGTARLRYGAACVLLVAAAAMPIATTASLASPGESSELASGLTEWIQRKTGDEAGAVGPSSRPSVSPASDRVRQLAPLAGKASRSLLSSVAPWLALGWGVCVLLLTLRLAGAWCRLQRLRRGAPGPPPDRWDEAFRRLTVRHPLSRPVRLLSAPGVDSPSVIGWLQPTVLVPSSGLPALTTAQVEAVLAHELSHVRRHDHLVGALQSVVDTLLFHHPGARWISRRIDAEREHCCDDAAVEVCGDRRSYAEALVRLEEGRMTGSRRRAAASGGDGLVSRVRRLVDPDFDARSTAPVTGLIGTVATAAVLTVIALGLTAATPASVTSDARATTSARAVDEDVEVPHAPDASGTGGPLDLSDLSLPGDLEGTSEAGRRGRFVRALTSTGRKAGVRALRSAVRGSFRELRSALRRSEERVMEAVF